MMGSTIRLFKWKIVRTVGFLFVFGLFGGHSHADTRVDLELVLAIDVSGSVFAKEYVLQVAGLSGAFQDPEVIEAIGRAGPNGIAVSVVQWSGLEEQFVALGWTHLKSAESIKSFSARLAAMKRRFIDGYTRIDAAILFSSAHFANNGYSSPRQIIDVSGDGGFETKGQTRVARDIVVGAGFIINGLAIETDVFNLSDFYGENVIGGAGSFVIKALNYMDFQQAIRRKLVREIAPLQISRRLPDKRSKD